ncbi:hypothetical protein HpKG54_07510 [Helicobacter pylori]
MNAKKKGKDPKEALKHTAIATLKDGARSYGIASVGSLLGGMMQNSTNKVIQNLGNGLVPTMVVGVGVGSCEVLINIFVERLIVWSVWRNWGKKTPNF